jgi:hypothetical protein
MPIMLDEVLSRVREAWLLVNLGGIRPPMRDIWPLVNQMIRWHGIKALPRYRNLIIPQDP